MVEVELSSDNCNHLIEWYVMIFGTGKNKAKIDDIRLLSKIETMRDALLIDEDNFEKLTK